MKKLIVVDAGKYKSVELRIDEAEQVLQHISRALGAESQDLEETYRVLRNFDSFYELSRKKYKDYVVPSKSLNDMIKGVVIVDRLKLIKEGEERKIIVTFDRRVKEEIIAEALSRLGYVPEVSKIEAY